MKHTNQIKAFISVLLILAALPGCTFELRSPIVLNPTDAPSEAAAEQTEAPIETAAGQPVQAEQEYTDHTNLLTSQNQKELNVFLSNFSEVDLGDYDSSNPSNALLIYFGTHHLQVNRNRLADPDSLRHVNHEEVYERPIVSPGGGDFYAAKPEAVASAVDRYFGKSINPASIQYNGWNVLYENDEYLFDCEIHDEMHAAIPYFSIAESMFQNTDGTYTVDFGIYSTGNIEIPIYELTAAEAAGNTNV
ncbi:MAG: hypothetical protein ACI38A_11720, partial [Candidatus Ornithomonoglobus sp.]